MTNYIVPAIFAFLVGLVLWFIKRERYSLYYEVVSSEVFPKDSGYGKYFVIKLANNGNKAIENAALKFSFNTGTVDSFSFSNADLISDIEQDENSIKANLQLINPKEILSTTITVNNADKNTKPDIYARAKGVTAVEKRDVSPYTQVLNVMAVIITCTALAVTINSYFSVRQFDAVDQLKDKIAAIDDLETKNKIEELRQAQKASEQGEPQIEHYLFAVFNKADLGHLYYDFVSAKTDIKYWKTGLFLMQSFLVDKKNSDKYLMAMSEVVNIDKMAPCSKGFNLYLLGKMHEYLGDSQKAIVNYNLCKKLAPLMYDHLMNQDPAYDLNKIKNSFYERTSNLSVQGTADSRRT